MSARSTVDAAGYVKAFETWATVAPLSDEERVLLRSALAVIPTFLRGDEERPIEVYCAAFDAYLSGRADRKDPVGAHCDALRLRITKSCLLDRLLYAGEPLSTTPCPLHKGKWSGLHPKLCPHGCDAACGCTSGWIPSPERLAEAAARRAALVPSAARHMAERMGPSLPEGTVFGEGDGEVIVYIPARAKLPKWGVPEMIQNVPVRVVRVRKMLPAVQHAAPKGGA